MKPVFRLETDASRFAARFLDPKEHCPDRMRGALCLLDHLVHRGVRDVETPVRNRAGDWVTEVPAPDLPGPVYVGLTRWLPGRSPTGSEKASPGVYRRLGRLAARLHEAAALWKGNGGKPLVIHNDLHLGNAYAHKGQLPGSILDSLLSSPLFGILMWS